ncbi:MAG TPA: DNA repair exonuclease [Candidatus Limnocylindrales bacterium]|nr:DNA repair exonuclease [Candidatus Limnocylindrales bacterium]
MKPFSFVHASDLHLGYAQYGLEARRQDFDNAFKELVDKTIELKVDFMIIAGDLFHQARPSNVTLENTIRNFKRLKDAGIPVLTVDGSHDSAPNTITGTILYPLDSAGLIHHLPRHAGASWRKQDCCYVYGIPNFHSKHKTQEALPKFMTENPARPDSCVCNIFVFHGAVDLPGVKPPYIEAELSPDQLPGDFNYYAAGHVHERYLEKFKTGLLVYSGCTETADYREAKYPKGFMHVRVNEKGEASPESIELSSTRRFIILEQEYNGMASSKITELTAQQVKDNDSEGAIIIPVLRGTLPVEASRSEIDLGKIRSAGEKALLVHPIVLLKETAVSDEIVRSIFESEFKDMKTKAFEYFLQIFSERYSHEEAEKIARVALNLIEPLNRKQEEKVRQAIEELTA